MNKKQFLTDIRNVKIKKLIILKKLYLNKLNDSKSFRIQTTITPVKNHLLFTIFHSNPQFSITPSQIDTNLPELLGVSCPLFYLLLSILNI